MLLHLSYLFFFNDTATTEIYTLSLHDALPISDRSPPPALRAHAGGRRATLPRRPPTAPGDDGTGRGLRSPTAGRPLRDRKSTRLNSSHANISYAVFCLKKKKETEQDTRGVHTR